MFNTKIKIVLIAAVILFVAVIIGGAVLQKTDAQIDIEACQREYSARWSQCISDGNTCSDACGENQDCKLNCNLQRNACEEAAVDQQRRCAHVWPYDQSADQDLPVVDIDAQPTLPIIPTPTVSPPQTTTPPPTVTPKPVEQPPAQTTPLQKSGVDAGDDSGNLELPPTSNLPEEIIVDGTFYSIALVDASTKNDFKKMVSAVTGPGPEVSITLKSESPTVVFTAGRDAGINSNAFVPDPYNFMLNTSNLAIVQPTIIFNDGAEDKFSIDVGKLMKSLEASNADTLEVDTNSFLQKKILEIMEQNPPTKTATFSISKTSAKPLFILSPAETLTQSLPSPSIYSWSETVSTGASFVVYPGSLVVLDTDAVNMNAPVMVGGPAVTSQTQDFDDKAMSQADVVFEVKNGKMIVVAGWSAEDTLPSVSDFVSALDNVEVRHRKTAYGMAIDPDSGKKIIEIYDGEINVFDRKTGVVLTTLSTEFGKGIKRVEIDKDGVVKRQIAIPQSEWPAFIASQQKKRFGTWMWVLTIIILGAAGYFAYRKKDELVKILKKESKPSI